MGRRLALDAVPRRCGVHSDYRRLLRLFGSRSDAVEVRFVCFRARSISLLFLSYRANLHTDGKREKFYDVFFGFKLCSLDLYVEHLLKV